MSSSSFDAHEEELRCELKEELKRALRCLQRLKPKVERVERHVNKLDRRLAILSMFRVMDGRRSDLDSDSDFSLDSEFYNGSLFDSSSSSSSDSSR